MRVAVLGTGIMGGPMARNLAAAGHEVVVWNRTRGRAEETGLEVGARPAEAASGADVVLTMLADARAVEQVVRAALPFDGIWLQMSTVGLGIEPLAALAAEARVELVDAPVLGTKAPAEEATLLVLASGPETALERVQPLLDAVGQRTVRLGAAAGAASRFKLVVNAWLLTLVEGLAETIALAEAGGVDAELFLEVIAGGPLDVPYAQLKGKLMLAREYPTSFPLRHALKDAELVREAAARAGVALPFADAAAARLLAAVEAGHGDEDLAALAEAARPSA